MTFEEYNKTMDAYAKRIEAGEDILGEVNEFQYGYMRNVLKEYTVDSHPKEIVYQLLNYAVNESQSGSAVHYIDSKELADAVMEIIWDEIGKYMLDYPECYKIGNQFIIDCMFAGYYIPEWDGWVF